MFFGTGLALVTRFVDAAAVCVADVALGDIDSYFMWQARQLAISMRFLRDRRHRCDTYGTGLALVARLVPSWRCGRRPCVHARLLLEHRPLFSVAGVAHCDVFFFWVAGVALGDIHLSNTPLICHP